MGEKKRGKGEEKGMEEGEERERDDSSKILKSVFFIPSPFLVSSCPLLGYDLQFFLRIT